MKWATNAARVHTALKATMGGRLILAALPSGPSETEELRKLAAELHAAMPPLREAFEIANDMPTGAKEFPAADAHCDECYARFDGTKSGRRVRGMTAP